jgi:hypothetical protein
MQNHLTYLAIRNHQRFIAISTSGTIHIQWEGQTLHLHHSKFDQLVHLMASSRDLPEYSTTGEPNHGGLSLSRGDGGDYHLTAGDFGMQISSQHFDSVVRMVEEACHWLHCKPSVSPPPAAVCSRLFEPA